MKTKLRKIVVLDKHFYWRFSDKIERIENTKEFVANSILAVFYTLENRKFKITINFKTIEYLYAGNPLNVGVGVNRNSEKQELNLNFPRLVCEIIESLVKNGIWTTENPKNMSINGLEILSNLGYEIEFLKIIESEKK